MTNAQSQLAPYFVTSCDCRFVPTLQRSRGTLQFGDHSVDVFFLVPGASGLPALEILAGKRSNSEDVIDPLWWFIDGVRQVHSGLKAIFAARLNFRGRDFSQQLIARMKICAQSGNLVRAFILGGRVHLDVRVKGAGQTTPLFVNLGYELLTPMPHGRSDQARISDSPDC